MRARRDLRAPFFWQGRTGAMNRVLFAGLIGIGGIAILLWLGTWQVQRLAWKQDLLAAIAAKIDASPVALAAALETAENRYLPVEITGGFNPGHVRVLASRKTIGPVYRVLRGFDAEGVGPVVVDTGWIRDGEEITSPGPEVRTLIGNLDFPNEIDSFTPPPDIENNVWFARDVPALAEALGTQPVMVVLREGSKSDLGVTPWAVDTSNIPNDHLQYAITWFSLAAIWAAMSIHFLRRSRRSS